MEYEEHFPVPVRPYLGRTGLLTHRIRETKARQRTEAHFSGEAGQTSASPSPQALPAPSELSRFCCLMWNLFACLALDQGPSPTALSVVKPAKFQPKKEQASGPQRLHPD